METKELRIGNYVYLDDTIKPVTELTDDGINGKIIDEQGFFFYNIKRFKPITLTEEWLLKFGFSNSKKYKNWFELDINNLIISMHYDSFTEKFVVNIERGGMKETVLLNVLIDSVHQLQNLYFTLTGEELTIKK